MFHQLFAICDKLGLEVKSQEGKFANFKLGKTELAIFEKSGATAMFPAQYMKSGGGALLGFQVEDVTQACEELKSRGIKIFEGPKTTEWGQTVAYFLDPDGNIWEVSNASFEE